MLAQAESADVVRVVQAAGGSIVGRTRLQKTIYLLELAGFMKGFVFEYRHYGPYSEELSRATIRARISGALTEEERQATWGGTYSIFRAIGTPESISKEMKAMIVIAAGSNPIALELAATAAFLAAEGCADPWGETVRRKADKAAYVDQGRRLYEELEKVSTPNKMPELQ